MRPRRRDRSGRRGTARARHRARTLRTWRSVTSEVPLATLLPLGHASYTAWGQLCGQTRAPLARTTGARLWSPLWTDVDKAPPGVDRRAPVGARRGTTPWTRRRRPPAVPGPPPRRRQAVPRAFDLSSARTLVVPRFHRREDEIRTENSLDGQPAHICPDDLGPLDRDRQCRLDDRPDSAPAERFTATPDLAYCRAGAQGARAGRTAAPSGPDEKGGPE
jgi:hypothetical protein